MTLLRSRPSARSSTVSTVSVSSNVFTCGSEGRREGGEGGRKGGREEGRKGGREGRKGGREGREEGREGGRNLNHNPYCTSIITYV